MKIIDERSPISMGILWTILGATVAGAALALRIAVMLTSMDSRLAQVEIRAARVECKLFPELCPRSSNP